MAKSTDRKLTFLLAIGKKLKKRLEDLERRAGTSDGASSASGNDKTSPPAKKRAQTTKTTRTTPPIPVKAVIPAPYTSPIRPEEEYLFQPTSYDQRDRSHSPPMFTYSTYPPPPEDMMMSAPYGAIPAYRHIQPAEPYPDYLSPPPVPVTLPSMTHYTEAVKRDPSYPASTTAEESYPYMSYTSYIPGVDMGPAGHPSPYEQMPHVSTATFFDQTSSERTFADLLRFVTDPASFSFL